MYFGVKSGSSNVRIWVAIVAIISLSSGHLAAGERIKAKETALKQPPKLVRSGIETFSYSADDPDPVFSYQLKSSIEAAIADVNRRSTRLYRASLVTASIPRLEPRPVEMQAGFDLPSGFERPKISVSRKQALDQAALEWTGRPYNPRARGVYSGVTIGRIGPIVFGPLPGKSPIEKRADEIMKNKEGWRQSTLPLN